MRTRILTLLSILLLGISATAGARPAGPTEGDAAPGFRLQDQNAEWHSLDDYRGKWVVLYFYPKDDTPGCTTEACNFRDEIVRYRALGAKVLGVSLDDVESHQEFAAKYSLPFPLLADVDAEAAQAYDVVTDYLVTKVASRQTFIIDPAGVIVKHYPDVDPESHAQEVLDFLTAHMKKGDTPQEDATG